MATLLEKNENFCNSDERKKYMNTPQARDKVCNSLHEIYKTYLCLGTNESIMKYVVHRRDNCLAELDYNPWNRSAARNCRFNNRMIRHINHLTQTKIV